MCDKLLSRRLAQCTDKPRSYKWAHAELECNKCTGEHYLQRLCAYAARAVNSLANVPLRERERGRESKNRMVGGNGEEIKCTQNAFMLRASKLLRTLLFLKCIQRELHTYWCRVHLQINMRKTVSTVEHRLLPPRTSCVEFVLHTPAHSLTDDFYFTTL